MINNNILLSYTYKQEQAVITIGSDLVTGVLLRMWRSCLHCQISPLEELSVHDT